MHASDPVNRIMSQPVLTIGPNEPVGDLLRLFLANPVHHVPVVEDRRVVGMLSSADVMKVEFFLPPAGPASDALLNERWLIKTMMRSPAVVVTEHESLQRAAQLMASKGIHALPVVNRDAELIGIVTTTDMIQCWLNPLPEIRTPDSDQVKCSPLDDTHVATVLASARRAVNSRHDPYGIAATLLSMHHRTRALEQVASAAKRYVNAGQDEALHAKLSKAIEQADLLDERTRHAPILGLSIGD